MSDTKHTPEPWRVRLTDNAVYYIFRYTGNGDEEEVIEYFTHDNPGQDARRIVACVNACAGISTEELESTVCLEQALTCHKAEIVALRAERDAVRDALDGIIDYAEDWHDYYCEMWGQRRKEQQDAILGALLKARAILADKPYAS